MSNNYDEYGYEDNENKDKFGKILLIIIFVIIAIIIIIYLLSSCGNKNITNNSGKTNIETTLLEAGKKYYENNGDMKPISKGECTQVELQKLIDKQLVDANKFDGCNLGKTYVRACMLANGTIHYTPWFTCTNKNSDNEYGAEQENGKLVPNSSYLNFKFIPYVLSGDNANLGPVEEMWKDEISYTAYKTVSTTTYYKYRDKLYKWNVASRKYYTTPNGGEKTNPKDVKEYYTQAPSSKYPLNDSKTTEAYKWYTTTSEKVYAMNSNGAKALSANQIGDYSLKENPVVFDYYESRKITGSTAPTLYYLCSQSSNSTYAIYQPAPCGTTVNPELKFEKSRNYFCKAADDSNSNMDNPVSKDYKCNTYSEWVKSTVVCDVTKKDICTKKQKVLYNWYKLVDSKDRTYYPSGASTSAREKVYYTEAPVKGAIPDTSTKTTAYKWYNETKSTTSNYTAVAPSGYYSASKTSDYRWSDWSNWNVSNPKTNDGRDRDIQKRTKIKLQQILATTDSNFTKLSETPLTEQEMINLYKSKNINISSLDDINNNGQVKYELVTYVRNKKENK